MSIIAAFGFLPLVGKQLIPPCWQTNIFVCSLGGNKYQLPAKSNNPIKVQPTFPPNVASTSPFLAYTSRNANHSPTIHQPHFRGSWVAWQRSSTPAGPNRPHPRNRWPRSVPHALPGDLEMCLVVALMTCGCTSMLQVDIIIYIYRWIMFIVIGVLGVISQCMMVITMAIQIKNP